MTDSYDGRPDDVVGRLLMRFLGLPGSDAIYAYFERLARAGGGGSMLEVVNTESSRLDNKATALLTHVSMMIATSGILLPLIASSAFERGIVIVEMTVYMLAALLCIRCIASIDAFERAGDADAGIRAMMVDVYCHRRIYAVASRMTRIMTTVFFVTMPALALYRPEF